LHFVAMIFVVTAELDYTVRFRSAMILSLHAQHSASQTILEEHFSVNPSVAASEYADELGNRFVRLETGKHKELAIRYRAKVDCDFETRPASRIAATPVAALEDRAIPYLFPSRYCQSDRLGRLAWDLFGKIEKPHDKVIAITEWIYDNVEYVRGSTNSGTSAYDTVTQRVGVCRDFAHLGIALCRALNIPARYFTGYAYELDPPDFHACFECYIGGEWMIFDATRLAHMNGLVRIASGRDAADTAVASVFGSVTCTRTEVSCALGAGQSFSPMSRRDLERRGVSLPTS
jgi:transglutaminase-like putative cysteine protease